MLAIVSTFECFKRPSCSITRIKIIVWKANPALIRCPLHSPSLSECPLCKPEDSSTARVYYAESYCYIYFVSCCAALHILANIYILSESLPFNNWTTTTENIILMGILFGPYTNTIRYNHVNQEQHVSFFSPRLFFPLILSRALSAVCILFSALSYTQFIEML